MPHPVFYLIEIIQFVNYSFLINNKNNTGWVSMWIINYSIKNDNVFSENVHNTHWKFTYLSRDLNDLIERWGIWVSFIYTKRNQQKVVVLKFPTAESILSKGFILRGF